MVKRVAQAKPPPPAKPSPARPGKPKPEPALAWAQLGVTFWRLRPFDAGQDGDAPTFPVTIKNRQEKWAAERVASTTNFSFGDRVRFTLEASRSGFLYIVNREFYTDGTTGEAEVIFPTLRTRNGDNRVTAGSLVEVPAANDAVPYFTVRPRRPDYAGEELIVLLAPRELPGLEKTLKAQPLARDILARWQTDWSAETEVLDAEDGEGVAYTNSEAQAANSTSRQLTQDDPLPQTIYRFRLASDMPLLASLRMQAKAP